jgi:hypothetical protein
MERILLDKRIIQAARTISYKDKEEYPWQIAWCNGNPTGLILKKLPMLLTSIGIMITNGSTSK